MKITLMEAVMANLAAEEVGTACRPTSSSAICWIMAIAKIQQMAEEIAKLKEQVAALSAGKE